jgi:Ran GTPase-activating protein (RanGAP) involved in mRNA processing and transport
MRKEIREKIRAASNDKITLTGLHITDEEMEDIAREIRLNKDRVKCINFDNNDIGNKGAEVIAREFSNLQNLVQLDLQSNAIGHDGFQSLLGLLRTHPNMDLALYGNMLTDAECLELLSFRSLGSYPL